MKLQDALALINVIKYKPGSIISGRFIQGDSYLPGALRLQIMLSVPDRDSGDPIHIQGTHLIPEYDVARMDEWAFLQMIRHQIHQIERHEIDEQILVRGERLFDPHIDPKKRKRGSS